MSSPRGGTDCENCETTTSLPKPARSTGWYVTVGLGTAIFGGCVALVPFLTPALRKRTLPFLPATPKQIDNVFVSIRRYAQANNIAQVQVDKNSSNKLVKLVDLGSGDGRIVFDAAKRGFHAEGVELNATLVIFSKLKALTSGWKNNYDENEAVKQSLDDVLQIQRPVFRRADFWKIEMNEYDLIVVFGVQEIMKELGSKLKEEMKESSLIVSCRNPIPSYKSVFHLDDEYDSVWVYNKSSLLVENTEDDEFQEKMRKRDLKRLAKDDEDDDY